MCQPAHTCIADYRHERRHNYRRVSTYRSEGVSGSVQKTSLKPQSQWCIFVCDLVACFRHIDIEDSFARDFLEVGFRSQSSDKPSIVRRPICSPPMEYVPDGGYAVLAIRQYCVMLVII